MRAITPAPIDPPQVHETLWRFPQRKSMSLAFDIGANVGQSLRDLCLRYQTVVTCEPAEECWPMLEAEAAQWDMSQGRRVVVRHEAVTAERGVIELLELANKIDTGQLCTAQWAEWDNKGGVVKREVPAVTVDDLRTQYGCPDFVKIDVEGHEHLVLDGAQETLEHCTTNWLVEIHSAELGEYVWAKFQGAGYTTETVRHPHYPKGSEYYLTHFWIKAFAKRPAVREMEAATG